MGNRSTEALRNCPTTLYRIYDATDTLLYVGITENLEQRMREHRMTKSWARDEPARVETVLYPNRDATWWAERRAIETETPKYNQQSRSTKTRTVAAKLSDEEYCALREEAEQEERPVPWVLRRIIQAHLATRENR